MLEIKDLEAWTKEYFEKPENQEKAAKACQRYDRLLVKNIRQMMMTGEETIEIDKAAEHDPGKRLEKAKYETLPYVKVNGKKGSVRINMLDQTAEFIEE